MRCCMDDYKTIAIHDYCGGTVDVIVDAEDYDYLSQWSWQRSSPKGYARRTIRKKGGGYTTLYMHRLLLGSIDEDAVVDHINGNTLDNRKTNLRVCTQSDNLANCHVTRGSSGAIGVAPHYGKYQARINRNKKRIYLGRFNTISEARLAIEKYDAEHSTAAI